MKTSRAGRAEANIIQMGKDAYKPNGWMTQPRAEGLDTERPSGTLSFCGRGMLVRTPGRGIEERRQGEPASWALGNLYWVLDLYPVTALRSLYTSSHSPLYR